MCRLVLIRTLRLLVMVYVAQRHDEVTFRYSFDSESHLRFVENILVDELLFFNAQSD